MLTTKYNKDQLRAFIESDINKVEGCYLAGGALMHLFDSNEPINDLDLFFTSKEAIDEVTRILDDMVRPVGLLCFTSKRITGKYGYTYETELGTIQTLNFRIFSSKEDILDSFDFIACQLLLDGDTVHHNNATRVHITRKALEFHTYFNFKENYSLGKFIHRLDKYLNKGYSVDKYLIGQVHNKLNVLTEYYTEGG